MINDLVPYNIYPPSESLVSISTVDDHIHSFVNDLHERMFDNDEKLRRITNAVGENHGAIPGVPSERLKNFGLHGSIVDVLEELRKLAIRQRDMIKALGSM